MIGLRYCLAALAVGAAISLAPGRADASVFTSCDNNTAPLASVAQGAASYCGRYNSDGLTDVAVFQGIQYATQQRLQSPSLLAPAGTNVPAKNFGAVCPQSVQQATFGKEDCLYLNIWAPTADSSDPDGYPVLFFIHGGAFVFGSAADGAFDPTNYAAGFKSEGGMYDGTALARNGVIVVTINYRLGALGFMAYDPSASKPFIKSPVAGNYGIQDAITALQWVSTNIGNFGGNAGNITIAGESAGAMTVGLLNYSNPYANGSVVGAIMESNPMAIQYESPASGLIHHQATASTFLASLCQGYAGSIGLVCDGSGNSNDIRGTDWVVNGANGHPAPSSEQFISSQSYANLSEGGFLVQPKFSNLLPWTPFLDTGNQTAAFKFTDDQPVNGYNTDNGYKTHPVFYGTNRNEGVLFVDGLAGYIDAFVYNGVLKGLFKLPQNSTARDVVQVIQTTKNVDYNGTSVQPYCAGSSITEKVDCNKTTGFIEKSVADAFSNFATDFVFRCANELSGTQSAKAGAFVQPYIFANSPLLELFKNPDSHTSPCNLTSQSSKTALGGIAVCHGYELPFVFNTIQTVANPQRLRPATDADKALAGKMTTAWSNFAKQGKSLKPSNSGHQEAFLVYGDQDAFPKSAGSVLDAANCGTVKTLWTEGVVPKFD